VTTQEFVILTYGTVTMFDYPIVRLQMESLFNRFPLRHLTYRNHLKKSVQTIVQYGCGILILLSDDGRGAGFGTYAIDRMLLENGLVSNSDEARKKINVNHDANDYNAATILLKNHCPNMNIQMIMNSPTSIINKIEYLKALKKHSFEIKKWIFIQEELF
jgi:3,4-dihydroxy 2-butanone 4-phosphate synthase/GTP cyclohydrolase II